MQGKRTVEDLMDDMLSQATHGEFTQIFVVEALRYYSEMIMQTTLPPDDGDAVIAAKTWKEIAANVHGMLKENFEETPI